MFCCSSSSSFLIFVSGILWCVSWWVLCCGISFSGSFSAGCLTSSSSSLKSSMWSPCFLSSCFAFSSGFTGSPVSFDVSCLNFVRYL